MRKIHKVFGSICVSLLLVFINTTPAVADIFDNISVEGTIGVDTGEGIRDLDWVMMVMTDRCKTVEDVAVFFGSDWRDEDFDPRKITSPKERETLLQKGLSSMKETASDSSQNPDARAYCCDAVARIHYLRGEMKQALYWAPKGAEHGSVLCMVLLRDAYLQGNGVIPDLEEGIKWCLLAAAAGHEDSRNRTKDYSKDLASSTGEVYRILREAKRRAVEWTKAHPNVFVAS